MINILNLQKKMNINRKFLSSFLFLVVFLHSVFALEEISLKNTTEKMVSGEFTSVSYYVKDLNYSGNNTYLTINTESQDQGKTYAQIFLAIANDPADRSKAELFAVEKGNNQLFLSKEYISTKTNFYIHLECNEKCNVKMSFKYVNSVPLTFGSDYQYISGPKKFINTDHFTMTVPKENFPAVLYLVSPGDFAVFASAVSVSTSKQIVDVVFDEFDGGLIAVLNNSEILSGDGPRTLDFTVLSSPNVLVTIGTRKQDTSSIKLNVGHKMVYSFIETPEYKECFEFDGASNNTYTISILPFHKNLKVTEKDGKTIVDDLDYHGSFPFTFGATETSKTFCFSTSGARETIFGFQIEEYTTLSPAKNALKEPLYHGIIYSLFSKKNDAVYYRHYRREYMMKDVTNMNVNAKSGNIEVYRVQCKTFPNCPTTDDVLKNPLHEVNGFYTTQVDIFKEPSLLSSEQTLIVVKCLSEKCDYDVSFFSDSDIMELKAGERFSQFMINTETGDFKIRNERKDVNKIIVRLIPISGDLHMEMMPNPFVEYNTVYIGTDTIVEITAIEEYKIVSPLVDNFYFVVRASGPGYYSVSFELMDDSSKAIRNVPPGIYSMETMPATPSSKVTMQIRNRKVNEKEPCLATFFAMNCDIQISRDGKILKETDGIIQDIVESTDSQYSSGIYKYEVSLLNMEEKATFKDERCVIYVASVEKGNKIVMGEGQFLQMQLSKKVPSMTYLIPFTNLGKPLLANYVIENEIPLEISLSVEGQTMGKKVITKRNIPLYLKADDYKHICTSGVCNMEYTTKILNVGDIDTDRQVRYDFIARTENNVPSFLKKRLLREETVATDAPYFFITDVGLNEEGEIVLNYNKGNGLLAAKIIPKNETDSDPTWGGRYEFPDPWSGNSLKYDEFTQSIKYSINETKVCENGCDLLISVYTQETFREEVGININYFEDFSIFVKSTQKEDEMGGTVDIPANEFVPGHLEKLNTGYNKKDIYTITIHNDCKALYLEIQGELVDIYINFDKKAPTGKDDSEFQCENQGEDQVCKVTSGKFDNFRGHTLSFIVMSQLKESTTDFNAYYLFKFRAPHMLWEKYNLYEINSDHGVKCSLEQSGYCDFLFPLRNYEIFNVLYFYVEGEILADFKIYANAIDADEFEAAKLEDIENMIPRPGHSQKDTTDSFWKNLLEMSQMDSSDFVLVSVYSDKKTMLTMMNTYKENIRSTLPKPKASQIYKVETEGEDSSLIMSIPSDKDYEIHIQSIYGAMLIYARDEDNKNFFIKGNGDSVLITFNENLDESIHSSLEIIALEDDSLFFVEYKPRYAKDNLDKIKFGSSTEISYDDIGFPVDFYSRIPDNIVEKDYVVNVRYKGEHNPFSEEVIDNFDVRAAIVDFKWMQKRLRDKTKVPSSWTDGIYNSFLRSGGVSISTDEELNEGAQFVYVEMKTAKDNPKILYTDIHLEVSILPLNERKALVPDSQYNHAFLLDNQMECNLHTIKRRYEGETMLYLEFSSISPNVDFVVVKYNDTIKDPKTNDTDIDKYLKDKIVTGGKITLIYNFSDTEVETGNAFPERIILSVFNKETQFKKEDTAYVYRFITSNYNRSPNMLKEDDMKYTYYESKEMIIKSSQPTVFIKDYDDIVVPSDYYIMLLPIGSSFNTQSIALRRMTYSKLIFYDTKDYRKYLRIKLEKYPDTVSDAMTMFAMADNRVDLFSYKVAFNVTKDPQKKTDYIELNMDNETLEYQTEDNEDQYVFYFKINVPNVKQMQEFFDIKVKSKDNETENDLFFSATKLYPTRDTADLISDERLNDAIYAPRSSIETTKTIYLSVFCEQLCDFRLSINNAIGVAISPGEQIRHLFRGENNIHLPVFIGERQAVNKNQDKYLTIFTFGGDGVMYPNLFYNPPVNQSLGEEENESIEMIKFFNGYIITLNASKYPLENDAYFKLDVFAQSGLISVGARYMNDEDLNRIRVFDNEIRGLLLPENKRECFPIYTTPTETNEIEVTILTMTQVRVYLEAQATSEIIPLTEHDVLYQDSFVYPYKEEASICFERILGDSTPVTFAFQIIQNSNFRTRDSCKIASKVNGVIYKQHVDNHRIIYYRHSKYKELQTGNKPEDNTINFNLKIIDGDPKFYIHHCTSFPNCQYTPSLIKEYIINGTMKAPPKVGDFYIGAINTADEKHELSSDQYLVVVDCDESPIDCTFEISFYDEKDTLMLRPSDSFNQYMLKEDDDKFTFTILDPEVKQVDIKLHVLSGSAYIIGNTQPTGVKAPTTLDMGSNQIKTYKGQYGTLNGVYGFEIKADDNAYYQITVLPIENPEKPEVILPRGTVVLESFPVNQEKIIAFRHYFRKGELALWSVKFYSINCDLHVSVLNETDSEIVSFGCPDGFCHNELSLDIHPELYVLDKMRYKVYSEKIYGDDGDNMCKFYVASQERTQDDQLVYGMNAPFKLFFDKNFPNTKIVYPFTNRYDTLIMNLVLEDESMLNVTLKINGEKVESHTTMKGRAIATKGLRDHCKNNYEEACIAEYDINAMKQDEIDLGFIVDLSIKSNTRLPSYLQRRKIREEFMYHDEIQMYVSDVGDSEEGTIQVHFNRGKGEIFAKIVKMDTVEPNPNYRGRVVLPDLISAPLKMDKFTNQINYNTKGMGCENVHCEIYIGVMDTQ
ncbi:MAG: hypothetical protein MJ252_02605, partial [archaeon]|nr:hypothetical protein [archaeon]